MGAENPKRETIAKAADEGQNDVVDEAAVVLSDAPLDEIDYAMAEDISNDKPGDIAPASEVAKLFPELASKLCKDR